MLFLKKRTLSVAMTTFNGEKYLLEQLKSIAEQTRLPDELVVCDDASSDQTPGIVSEFATQVTFPVILKTNTTRIGVSENFEQALSLCSGDMIALADQDDVWLPMKLERCEAALREKAGSGLVFSDASIVDSNLQPLGFTMWEALGFDQRRRERIVGGTGIEVLLERNVVTGATMMFYQHFRPLVLPIGGHWVHDAWIAAVISVYAALAIVEEPMMLYRQHADNAVGTSGLFRMPPMNRKESTQTGAGLAVRRSPTLIGDLQRSTRKKYRDFYEQLAANQTKLAGDARIASLIDPAVRALRPASPALLSHLKARSSLPSRRLRRVSVIIRELVRLQYHRFSRRRVLPFGIAAALADLISNDVSEDQD